jgi:hypothetical protein
MPGEKISIVELCNPIRPFSDSNISFFSADISFEEMEKCLLESLLLNILRWFCKALEYFSFRFLQQQFEGKYPDGEFDNLARD